MRGRRCVRRRWSSCCSLCPARARPPRRPQTTGAAAGSPVVVEGVARDAATGTRTEEEAREELQRVPGGTAVIGQQADRRESRAANLKDVLDFAPGVMIRPRFGAADESQLSIRGSGLRNNFHLRGVNVLIDGFVYGQADGFSDFESLELLDDQAHRGLQGRQRAALWAATPWAARQPRDEDRRTTRAWSSSAARSARSASTRTTSAPARSTGPSTSTRLHRHRARRLPRPQRAGAPPRLRHASATTSAAAPRSASTSATSRNEEQLPGSLTRQEIGPEPAPAGPDRRASSGRRGTTTTCAAA